MKVLEFEGFEISEADDGGMHDKHVRFVATKQLAEEICKGHVFLSFRPIKQKFVLFESMAEIKDYDLEQLRKNALAKLTPAERTALGLL